MDGKEQQQNLNPRALRQLTKSQILKKVVTPFLVSVSLFSLLLSSIHFSLFQVVRHTLDKNYIFLFCNGLLVFLAKFSGLVTSSKENNTPDQSFKDYEQEIPSPLVDSVGEVQENVLEEKGSQEEGEENSGNLSRASGIQSAQWVLTTSNSSRAGENEFLIDEKVEKNDILYQREERELLGNQFCGGKEEELMEGNSKHGVLLLSLSTDELNKKCEEFIRRMKEDIRFEAQQQLVLAN